MNCAEKRYQLCVRNVMDKVMIGTLGLVLFFFLFTAAGHAQNPVQIKGVLAEVDSFRTSKNLHMENRALATKKSQKSGPIGLKQVRRTVRNDHVSIEFVLTNRSQQSFKKLYFAILFSDDRIIGRADKIATTIQMDTLQKGQRRNFQVQFTLPPEDRSTTFVGYTISEFSPEQFLTKTVKPAAAGAKIRLNQTNLTINQTN